MMKDILCSYSTTSWLVICNYYLPCIAYMAIHIQFLRNYFSNALGVLADNHFLNYNLIIQYTFTSGRISFTMQSCGNRRMFCVRISLIQASSKTDLDCLFYSMHLSTYPDLPAFEEFVPNRLMVKALNSPLSFRR